MPSVILLLHYTFDIIYLGKLIGSDQSVFTKEQLPLQISKTVIHFKVKSIKGIAVWFYAQHCRIDEEMPVPLCSE